MCKHTSYEVPARLHPSTAMVRGTLTSASASLLLNPDASALRVCMLSRFSRVQPFATPWTIACQAPLFMRFSRQEYWSGLPCPLPNPGIEPEFLNVSYVARQILYHCTTYNGCKAVYFLWPKQKVCFKFGSPAMVYLIHHSKWNKMFKQY